jgi:ABC-type cobalamin/Fe3+-siderophores transport system ATPase subunit
LLALLFFGREDLLEAIEENLAAAHRNNLVLIGQRRMGKTSLLKQLSLRLDPSFIPVYLDGQAIGLDPGMAHFFLNLATEIVFALEDKEIDIDQPSLDDFESSPASTFEHQFLPKVLATIEQRPLLVLFDEFEELESAVLRGYLDVSIFNYLRHLMQHTPNLSFIFCGTHRLEELVADYWNVLFNISLYQRVGYLSQKDAMHLVQQPVEAYGMLYDDLALDKIWRVTAGHPYFLQLICHSLVNRHNKTQRNYVTVADVNAALDEILSAGEAHFIYLWVESSLDERLALVAVSRMFPLTGSVQAAQVVDYLEERGVQVERRAIREALHHLMLRDILKVDETEQVEESIYRWQLGLLGLWAEKYKSLGRVLDEVAT